MGSAQTLNYLHSFAINQDLSSDKKFINSNHHLILPSRAKGEVSLFPGSLVSSLVSVFDTDAESSQTLFCVVMSSSAPDCVARLSRGEEAGLPSGQEQGPTPTPPRLHRPRLHPLIMWSC